MQPLLDAIARVGPSDANVMITGEHGTGKEVVAQTLHAVSARAAQTLVTVNTGALPEGTFESKLFGHTRGAFTDARTDRVGCFELANKGTLFPMKSPTYPSGNRRSYCACRRAARVSVWAHQKLSG